MSNRRRRILVSAMGGAALFLSVRRMFAAGQVEKGVYRVRGDARINGAPAKPGMELLPGSTVTTGRDGEIVFVIGADAVLVRADSRVEIAGATGALVATGLRIVTGAVLSVFGPGARKNLVTSTATIGIRGTGVYVESEPDRTYVCTCYGEAELAAIGDPAVREVIKTSYHEQPRYIMAKGAPQMLTSAPMINHTDAELTLLEGLQGRKPRFAGNRVGTY